MKGLKEKEIKQINEELLNSQRPIFLFHDDADGLCSFLLFYKYIKEGTGVVVKSRPIVDSKFSRKVIEYEADKIFVLDIAILKQDFVDQVKRPVIWIDHHTPGEVNKVTYFNPRKHKSDIVYPVTNVCYDVVKQDMWIAMVGCVGDWHMPYFKKEFCSKYPDLMDEKIEDPGEALFEKINETYEKILEDATSKVDNKDRFIVYCYPDSKMSFTGEISNNLLHLYPDKIIIIAREKSGEMRMSLRSKGIILPPILQKALVGLEGYGGGHEYACGACVKKEQFSQFVDNLRLEIK